MTGAQAGSNAVQNNYLSKAQKAQRDAEMASCEGTGCRTGTATKWMAIDIAQDASFTAGTAAGAVLGLNDAVDSIVHTAGNLRETYAALKAVVESGGVWDSVKQTYIDRIDKLQAQFEEAGPSGSYLAGVETGKLLSDMAGVLSVGGGVVKGGALLAEKVAAKVTKAEFEAVAKASTDRPPLTSNSGGLDTKAAAEAPKPASITTITDEMKADPYDPDWQRYVGNEPRAVGADVVSGGEKGAVIPKGFSSADDFVRFGTDTRDGLARAGYENVEPILQGSAVTGKSFKTGEAFDVGRVSDFDVALASPELLQRAQSLGIGLRSGGTRTGPLSARDLQALGLKNLSSKMSAQAGREVNFMIYDSAATAASRAPSAVLPK